MRKFYNWICESNNITINYDELNKSLHELGDKVLSSIADTNHRLSTFNPETFINDLKTKLSDYPLLPNLIKSLQSKNSRYIMDQFEKFRKWTDEKYKGKWDLQSRNEMSKVRELSKNIFLYMDSYSKRHSIEESEADIKKTIQNVMVETQKNMENIKDLIEQAISRISNWNNSPIIIHPSANKEEFTPSNSAQVMLGIDEMSPSFMIDEKIDIDDIIEGGDEDFFKSPQIQSDYFNLINELKKPGSTNKGKILTLYTARPKKDRQQYLASQELPVNVFLANSYDHVEGIASDFGGERDIWRVRVDSRYLTQTLDGNVKYYQVIKTAPAKMELLLASH